MTQSWVFKDKKFAGQLRRERTFQTEGRRHSDDLRRCPCSQESASQSPQWEERVNRERGGKEKYWGSGGRGWLLETWKGQQAREFKKSRDLSKCSQQLDLDKKK